MNLPIYAIQSWKSERWMTFYLNSYGPDAKQVYADLIEAVGDVNPDRQLRLIVFSYEDYDFLSTHARDYRELGVTEPPL